MEVGKELLVAEYEAMKAQRKLEKFNDEEELEEVKFMAEKKKALQELERLDLEAEVKRKELEVQLAKLEADEARYTAPKKEPRNPVVEGIERARENMSALEEAKQEIRDEYEDDPELAEYIIDGIQRDLFERGLMGDEED